MSDPRTAETLTIPPLPVLFQARLHPRADWIDQRSIDWMLSRRLIEPGPDEAFVRQMHMGRLAAWSCPDADTDHALLLGCLLNWLVLLDDRLVDPVAEMDEMRELAERWLSFDIIVHDPQAATVHNTPMESALRDLCRRIRPLATADQWTRIQEAITRTLVGYSAKAGHKSDSYRPSLAQFRHIRYYTSGLLIFPPLLEIFCATELPPDIALDSDIHVLNMTSAAIVTTVHEIATCAHDVRRGIRNLPALLAEEHACSTQDGLHLAAIELGKLTDQFNDRCSQVEARNLPGSAAYIKALQHLIAGHPSWTEETKRYTPGASSES
ncbi:terpene synthase family protein [Streptomyces rubiginosohelvolus]